MPQEYGWPEGVPRDYEELSRLYALYIKKRIKSLNRVERNFDDIYQDVWCRLITAKVLERFHERALRTIPPIMTATEAVCFLGIPWHIWKRAHDASAKGLPASMTAKETSQFLGVSWEEWLAEIKSRQAENDWIPATIEGFVDDPASVLSTFSVLALLNRGFCQPSTERVIPEPQSWMPKPMEGSPDSRVAIFSGADISELDGNPFFMSFQNDRERPLLTRSGFIAYLSRAIRNHFSNWCRTKSRRHKERVMAPSAVVIRNSSGTYSCVGHMEDRTNWEGSLIDAIDGDAEMEMADVLEFVRNYRENLGRGEAGRQLIERLLSSSRGREAIRRLWSLERGPEIIAYLGSKGTQIMEALSRGLSLGEAIEELTEEPLARAKTPDPTIEAGEST